MGKKIEKDKSHSLAKEFFFFSNLQYLPVALDNGINVVNFKGNGRTFLCSINRKSNVFHAPSHFRRRGFNTKPIVASVRSPFLCHVTISLGRKISKAKAIFSDGKYIIIKSQTTTVFNCVFQGTVDNGLSCDIWYENSFIILW